MKINILHSPQFTPNQHAFLAPLHREKNQLKSAGIDLHFFNRLEDAALSAHTVFLSSKFFSAWWPGFTQLSTLLLRAKSLSDRLFWFDLSDSSGTTHFKVLPYVDKYIKNQVLKNKAHYQKKYHGMRITTDFYHRHFNLKDNSPDEPHLNVFPSDQHLNKIHVGWNSGLTYYGVWRHALELLTWHQPRLHRLLQFRFHSPDQKRNILCSGRFGTQYQRTTAGTPRQYIQQQLQGKISTQKINTSRYHHEMRHSYACLSPFGLGEITLRDFEITWSGAAMIKQNMDHLATWPDLWRKDETYLDFKWDLSDLNEKVDHAMTHPSLMRELAHNAQSEYYKTLTSHNHSSIFTEHLLQLLR